MRATLHWYKNAVPAEMSGRSANRSSTSSHGLGCIVAVCAVFYDGQHRVNNDQPDSIQRSGRSFLQNRAMLRELLRGTSERHTPFTCTKTPAYLCIALRPGTDNAENIDPSAFKWPSICQYAYRIRNLTRLKTHRYDPIPTRHASPRNPVPQIPFNTQKAVKFTEPFHIHKAVSRHV